MAMAKYIQWTPISPLGLFGRIDATVVTYEAPIHANQISVTEDMETEGYLVDLLLFQLVLP